jgi:hypothetical protein
MVQLRIVYMVQLRIVYMVQLRMVYIVQLITMICFNNIPHIKSAMIINNIQI